MSMTANKRIVLSAGHDNIYFGASSNQYYLTEHQVSINICDMVTQMFKGKIEFLDVDQYTREFSNIHSSLKRKIDVINTMHKDNPIDLAIELHFNASPDRTGHGSEVLYHNDSHTGKHYADIFSPLLESFDGKFDGRPNLHTHTKAFISRTLPPAIILEPLFIDNPADAAILLTQRGRMRLVIAIADGINLSMKEN